MDKKDKVNKAMNQAYGVDGKPISGNKKHYYKKNFSKKRNWVVIVNLIQSDKIEIIIGCIFLVVVVVISLIIKAILK